MQDKYSRPNSLITVVVLPALSKPMSSNLIRGLLLLNSSRDKEAERGEEKYYMTHE
jgi:hypothetical protein